MQETGKSFNRLVCHKLLSFLHRSSMAGAACLGSFEEGSVYANSVHTNVYTADINATNASGRSALQWAKLDSKKMLI